MININEVAKLAHVSPATVSRVLNETANVNEDKKTRVLKVVRETGFKPNEIARSLYKKSSRTIGYMIPSILNIFLNEIGRAIEAEAFRKGYKVILCNTDGNPDKELSYINMLVSMNADGIIITSNNEQLDKVLCDCPIPTVIILDEEVPTSAANIQSDNYRGGYLAAEHLIECGCRRIVQMRAPQKYESGKNRFQGYLDVCEKYDIEPRYIDSNFDFDSGITSTLELLKRFPDADGILATSDMSALSTYKVLYEWNKRIPDDIMIVGYDGVQISSLMTPELTTIVQPIGAMGRLAVKLIIDMTSNKKIAYKQYIMPVSLEIRQTTRNKK